MGYSQWRRFHGVVRRAKHLIETGEECGRIRQSRSIAQIGSGAVRLIVDYELDADAIRLISRLGSAYRLTSHYPIRNETVLLRLLKKYCEAKGIAFEFQPRISGFVFDALVSGDALIEFDEPHHEEGGKTERRDAAKSRAASTAGFRIVRCSLDHDIVDLILLV